MGSESQEDVAWKFAEFTETGRARLGETMAADMAAADFGDATKREKTRTKYLRAPSVLVVGCEPHANETLHQENRDAVASRNSESAPRRNSARPRQLLVDSALLAAEGA